MNENRNIVLAVILSVAVMGLWQFFVTGPQQEAYRTHQAQIAEQQAMTPKANLANTGLEAAPVEAMPRQAVLESQMASRVKINTPTLHGSLSTKGLRFDDLTLIDYHQTIDPRSPEVVLLSPASSKSVYFAELGWAPAGNLATPNKDTVWTNETAALTGKSELTPQNPLTFSWKNGQGVKFVRQISVDKRYMFSIADSVVNNSGQAIALAPYGLVNREKTNHTPVFVSHEGIIATTDGVLEELSYDDLKDGDKFNFKETKGWLGIADQYWMATLVPDQELTFDLKAKFYTKNEHDRFQVDFLGKTRTVAVGETHSVNHRFYAGAKKVRWLDSYADDDGITLFDRAVDYGSLYFLTKPMFIALDYFYHLVGHFGIAILMLTVLVKLIMFPLANKSYTSMAKMRLLMPEVTDLRAKYKDDNMEMNRQLMDFYKRKGVNPAAGCLPILIQIPIFFALYKMLYVTIEMRHQPFFGWINDLSAPDPTSIFTLFGFAPWEHPALLPVIGLWPLLFCITMVIQQKLSPPPADPTQRMIMRTLPFIFVFLFASFPAGLVIYWTWSNTLSILQQWVITRKLNADLHHQVNKPKPAKGK